MVDRIETDVSPFKPGGVFVNPDGTLTGDGYRFLDQLWQRSGGFSDGSWDVGAQVSALESQVGDLSRTLEAIQFDVERAAEVSESALRQALNIEDKNVVTGGIRTRGIGRNATYTITPVETSGSVTLPSDGSFSSIQSLTVDIRDGIDIYVDVQFDVGAPSAETGLEIRLYNGATLLRTFFAKPSSNFISTVFVRDVLKNQPTGPTTYSVELSASNTLGGISNVEISQRQIIVTEMVR